MIAVKHNRAAETYWEEAPREDVEQTGLSTRAVTQQNQFALDDLLTAAQWHCRKREAVVLVGESRFPGLRSMRDLRVGEMRY